MWLLVSKNGPAEMSHACRYPCPYIAPPPPTLNLRWPVICINQWNAAEVTMQDFWVLPWRSHGSIHCHTLLNPEPACQRFDYLLLGRQCGKTMWRGQMKRERILNVSVKLPFDCNLMRDPKQDQQYCLIEPSSNQNHKLNKQLLF